nr:family 16 glycoside hydrolase [Ktedonobacteraceae bacterium]
MSSNYPPFGSASALPCQRCGNLLPPNEARCTHCGLMNTSSQPNNAVAQSPSGTAWGGPTPQQSFGSGQQGGQPWGQPPSVQPVQHNPFANSPASQQSFGSPNQPFSHSNPFYGSSNQQSPTSALFGGTPGQSTGTNGFGFSASQPPSYAQQSPTTGTFQNNAANGFAPSQQQQNGFSPNNARGFSSSGFGQQPQQPITGNFTPPPNMNGFQTGGFTQSASPNGFQQERPVPPPERKRRPKVGLISAVIVLLVLVVGGGLGGYYYVKHSNTSAAQATPTVAPTPTPTGNVLFSDTFANNNKGWDLTTKAGEFSVKVGGGSMALEDDNNKLLWELIPGGKTFSDFYMTVDATLSKGTQSNGYGIYIRGSSNQTIDIATYYRFEIYGDGSFAIFKGTVDSNGVSNSSFLVTYTNISVIQKQGHVNHIAINAKGSTLTFYVNGQIVKIVTDNTYTTGSIALFVSNLPHTTPGAQATFANLAIYPPQH